MKCSKCGGNIKRVIRFTPQKALEFYRCPSCWIETRFELYRYDTMHPIGAKQPVNMNDQNEVVSEFQL